MPDDIDTTTPEADDFNPRIESVDLQVEMQRSYMDYAMSVIVSRALPDVRDGLKPVHRRVLYAMFDGGYRPDRGFSKCARVVGDVMGNYHPHGDSSIYDALVRLAQPWSLRYPLVDGQGNFGSPGNDPAAAMRYTEARMAPLAMEMVRDIDEETVDFTPNYDGRTQEPVVLPSRFPNLLVNGSAGIAVGMATNIPPHNLREVADGRAVGAREPGGHAARSCSRRSSSASRAPTSRPAASSSGARASRTPTAPAAARSRCAPWSRSRRTTAAARCWSSRSCPTRSTPTTSLLRIAELANDGKIAGISDVRDDSSSRTGMRLVIELKRDAVAKVVLNNLYKHTQLQDTFGCNMLALVDGVPRTLPLDGFVRHWIAHQIEVIVRRTTYRLRKAEERAHILRGYLKALDALDEVIALIRASATVDDARTGLMELLEIDEIQATAILDMQLRRLAALERQKIIDEYDEIEAKIADYNDILANEPRQRTIVSEELAEIIGEVRRRAPQQHHRLGRRGHRRGPHRRGGRRRHDHARRLRQAHGPTSTARSVAAARACAVRRCAGRHRRALLRHDHAPLAAVLHQQGPGLPGEGLRAARGRSRRARSARGQPAGVPARRDDRAGARRARLRRLRRTSCSPPATAW